MTNSFERAHCDWFCDFNFFEKFAKKNNYKMWFLGKIFYDRYGFVVHCIMEKLEECEFNFNEEELHFLLYRN